MTLREAAFDPRETIGAMAGLIAPRAAAKGLEFALELDPALPAAALGDEERLRQALLKLLDNAVKFTPARPHHLRRRAARRDGGRLAAGITITDTGIGITPEAEARLFEPFAQADSSTARPLRRARAGPDGLPAAAGEHGRRHRGRERRGGRQHLPGGPAAAPRHTALLAAGSHNAGATAAGAHAARVHNAGARNAGFQLARGTVAGAGGRGHRGQPGGGARPAAAARARGGGGGGRRRGGRRAAGRILRPPVRLHPVRRPPVRRHPVRRPPALRPGADGPHDCRGWTASLATRAIRALPDPAAGCRSSRWPRTTSPAIRQQCREAGIDGFEGKPLQTERLRRAIAAVMAARAA